MAAARYDEVLVTCTGRQHPQLLQTLAGVAAGCGAELRDVEQVEVRGRLLLCLHLQVRQGSSCRQELLQAAERLGVELSFDKPAAPESESERHVVTAFGKRLGAADVEAICRAISGVKGRVESVRRLAETPLAAFELHAALPPWQALALKQKLLHLAMRSDFDLALQPEGLYRRARRMVVFDMDSTLVRIEVIDELARIHGVVDQVSAITERAMQGEMDYDESLRQRVALLAGLDVSALEEIASNLPLTEGAETLIRALRRLGYKVAVLSGGFSVAATALRDRLGLDEAHSNELEVKNGKLTGGVVGPIVNAQRKAELLEEIAGREGILLDQVIAVGDGANDLLMLEKAGLGIAFRAKPTLRAAADLSIAASGLDAILYLLGISERELAEIG